MKIALLAPILFSVTCSAVAQLILKTGMSTLTVPVAFTSASPWRIFTAIATNPWIIGGLGLYFLGAIMWLFVLAKTEVSFAYPFVGLGFILTLILGAVVMGDNVTPLRVIGTLLVAGGVILIAK